MLNDRQWWNDIFPHPKIRSFFFIIIIKIILSDYSFLFVGIPVTFLIIDAYIELQSKGCSKSIYPILLECDPSSSSSSDVIFRCIKDRKKVMEWHVGKNICFVFNVLGIFNLQSLVNMAVNINYWKLGILVILSAVWII